MEPMGQTDSIAAYIEMIAETGGCARAKGTSARHAIFNRWWHRCCRTGFPYVVVIDWNSKKVDLRLEIQTMDAPCPEQPTRLSADAQSEICDLAGAGLTADGYFSYDQDGFQVYGVRADSVKTLVAKILAVVLRDGSRVPRKA